MKEKASLRVNGFLMLFISLLILFIGFASMALDQVVLGFVSFILFAIILSGFTIIQPNNAKVLIFFGKYLGVVRKEGFHWVTPLTLKQNISLRVRNFDTDRIKVNDAEGNPIEIAAVVVWKVVDAAKASISVDDYREFIDVQSDTAIRTLASQFPYDEAIDRPSLRGNPTQISEYLQEALQERLDLAGLEVIEARISHLAYAPEIAQAMLRRQQAKAVVDARKQIVEGAVGMVENALQEIESRGIRLDNEKRAAMVNNLLVALVSEGQTQPVVNTGTLYT